MYRYKGCALDQDVLLASGYEIIQTPDGEAVAVEDVEGLHRLVALELTEKKALLSSREFSFLREELDLSRASLAVLLGEDEHTVASWEGRGPVPQEADRRLRAIYQLVNGNAELVELIEQLSGLEESARPRLAFTGTNEGWRPMAA